MLELILFAGKIKPALEILFNHNSTIVEMLLPKSTVGFNNTNKSTIFFLFKDFERILEKTNIVFPLPQAIPHYLIAKSYSL